MFKTDKSLHLLYNFESQQILAVSQFVTTINLLTEISVNCRPWYFSEKVLGNNGLYLIPDNFDTSCPWNFKFNANLKTFQKDIINNDVVPENFLLINLKSNLLDKLTRNINNFRRPFYSNFLLQDEIYSVKLHQAREFLSIEDKNNINVDDYVFIRDAAALANIDMVVAAKEIIAQSHYRNKRLSFTENMRIKYVKAILNSMSIVELNAVGKELDTDSRIYPKF